MLWAFLFFAIPAGILITKIVYDAVEWTHTVDGDDVLRALGNAVDRARGWTDEAH